MLDECRGINEQAFLLLGLLMDYIDRLVQITSLYPSRGGRCSSLTLGEW